MYIHIFLVYVYMDICFLTVMSGLVPHELRSRLFIGGLHMRVT